MKRKVLGVFSLIAWGLVVCTLLSAKIEEQMTAQVVTATSSLYGPTELPMESLSYDERGYHLFEMVEGTGWESGLRARELGDQSYSIVDNENNDTQQVAASASYNAKLIQFSSRPLRAGELVEVVDGQDKADDVYLAIFPEVVPELDGLPTSFSLESRTDTAMLLSVTNAAQPFMETRARSQLYQVEELRPYIHPMIAALTRVYSLSAAEQFMENVPVLSELLVLALFPLALWAASLIATRRGKGRGIVIFNVSLTAVDAVFISKALSRIDLPTSLLPTDMIFDFGHYISELKRIFDTLKTFGDNELVQSALQAAGDAQHTALIILLAGLLIAIFVITLESIVIHLRNRSRSAYSGTGFTKQLQP